MPGPTTRKWRGTVAGGVYETGFASLPVNDDSITFYGADLAGAAAKLASAPLVAVSLANVTSNAAYGDGLGGVVICFFNMVVATLNAADASMSGGTVATAHFTIAGGTGGGTITTATFEGGTFLGGAAEVVTATFADTAYMTGGTASTATFNGSSYMDGGAVTGTLTWNSDYAAGIVVGSGNIDLSGCAIVAMTDLVLDGRVATFTTGNGTTVNFGAAGKTITLDGGSFYVNLYATLPGTYFLKHSTHVFGVVDCASPVTWTGSETDIAIYDTSTLRFGGPVPTNISVTINADGGVVTAGEALDVNRFTVSDGTFVAGAYAHIFRAGFLQIGGTVTSTGRFIMAATGTFTLTTANTGAGLVVDAGTTTLGADASLGYVHVSAGATMDGATKTVTVANKVIQGGGTITNVVVPNGQIYYTTCTIGSGCDTATIKPLPMEVIEGNG